MYFLWNLKIVFSNYINLPKISTFIFITTELSIFDLFKKIMSEDEEFEFEDSDADFDHGGEVNEETEKYFEIENAFYEGDGENLEKKNKICQCY